jgi:hypothetical protein
MNTGTLQLITITKGLFHNISCTQSLIYLMAQDLTEAEKRSKVTITKGLFTISAVPSRSSILWLKT